ncbi:MAG: hypothetical protein V3S70_05215, partial [Gammaproteobacteria bacterium]
MKGRRLQAIVSPHSSLFTFHFSLFTFHSIFFLSVFSVVNERPQTAGHRRQEAAPQAIVSPHSSLFTSHFLLFTSHFSLFTLYFFSVFFAVNERPQTAGN